jgi:hypothetical protein
MTLNLDYSVWWTSLCYFHSTFYDLEKFRETNMLRRGKLNVQKDYQTFFFLEFKGLVCLIKAKDHQRLQHSTSAGQSPFTSPTITKRLMTTKQPTITQNFMLHDDQKQPDWATFPDLTASLKEVPLFSNSIISLWVASHLRSHMWSCLQALISCPARNPGWHRHQPL